MPTTPSNALYEFLSSYTLTRDPGKTYEYSNLGAGLLGHALALRAQTSYETLVCDRVCSPLGMTSTAITIAGDMARHLASGHGEPGNVVGPWDLPTLAGAGALRSSIGDMLRFAEANLGAADGALQQALKATHTPRKRIGPVMRIGLNWHILGYGARTILIHTGGTGGFSSFVGLYPGRGTATVVLSNSSFEAVEDIGMHLMEQRLKLSPAPRQRTSIALPADVLERYVGVYDMAGTRVEITRSAEGLSARVAGAGTYRLDAETEAAFFVKEIDAQVNFRLARDGVPTKAVLHQGGQRIPIKKVA